MSIESVLAGITTAAGDFAHLPACLARYRCLRTNFGADSSAIGNTSLALNNQPFVAVPVVSIEEIVLIVQGRDKQVQKAVVVKISPSAPIADGSVID